MKFLYNTKFLAIALIIFISIPALRNLAKEGFYTSHDGETHTARIAQYYRALSDSQFPPRFSPTLYNGLGSPIFVYIYPLPYLLGAAIHATSFSFSSSFKLIMALSFVFSGIFTYFWLKTFFKSEKSGILGAIFYIWAPYRLSLIYVRGSVSEMLSYTFLPLAFYSFTKLSERTNFKWMAVSALSLSLVLLSQNLVAVISIPVLSAYVLLLFLFNRSPKYLIFSLLGGIWAFAIAAITYLPALFERQYIRLDEIIKIAYPDHFVTLKQVIYSPWGYGFDLPGTQSDQLSFQIGLAHILVVTVAVLTPLSYLLLKRVSFFKNLIEKPTGKTLIFSTYFLIVLLLSAFLMIESKTSSYIWQNFKQLQIIDIPWRLLGIITLSVSFIAAFVAKSLKPAIITIIFIAAVLVANRNHLKINQSILFDDNHFQNYIGTATQYNEFTPKWRQTTRVPIGFELDKTVEVISGEAKIIVVESKSNKISFSASVISDEAIIRINKFYFPGWQVRVNGQKQTPFESLTVTDSTNEELDKEKDTSGLMQLNLKNGNSQVDAVFTETPLRNAANVITFLAIFISIGVLIKYAKA